MIKMIKMIKANLKMVMILKNLKKSLKKVTAHSNTVYNP